MTSSAEILKLDTKLLAENEFESSAFIGQFPGINVSETADFDIYKHKLSGKIIAHGESEKLEYEGESEGKQGNKYCIAVYDSKKKSIEILPTPLVTLSTVVKSKKRSQGPSIKQLNVQNIAQKTALGEAFGTKKAKKAISNYEKNRIDSDQLKDLETSIIDTVKVSTDNLPSKETIQNQLQSERPIPPYNLETSNIELVYPIIDGVLTKDEYESLRVANLILKEKDISKRYEMLAQKTSNYIRSRLDKTIDSETSQSHKIHRIKLLYYASFLLAVYENKRITSKQSLLAKLGNPPEILVHGIIDKFSITKAGHFGRAKNTSFVIDPANEDKLLCYLLVLLLHIDGFTVDIQPLVSELSLKQTRISDLFKAIGCSIKSNTTSRSASLRAPLRLPDIIRRKRAAGASRH